MELKLIKGQSQELTPKKRKQMAKQQLELLIKEHAIAKKTAGKTWPKVSLLWQGKIKEKMALHGKTPFEAIHFIFEEIDAVSPTVQGAMLKTYVTGAAVELVAGK